MTKTVKVVVESCLAGVLASCLSFCVITHSDCLTLSAAFVIGGIFHFMQVIWWQ
jgi:hypothetical protein